VVSKLAVTALRGFCMGAADIVPGVSGGTVALVFGIYDRLLTNIATGAKALGSLLKADITGFRHRLTMVEWRFLIPLGLGLLVAVGLLSSLIEGLLQDRPEEMAGLFFGLVAGSIIIAWQSLAGRSSQQLAMMAAVGAVTFAALGFQSGPVVDPPLLAYLGAGAIAICAMILPGVSGSFLLLMMGMYAAVLGAVHDRDVVSLGVFLVGAVIGLSLFSTGLGWLLSRHYGLVLAGLIGLMVGSLRVLWPWPNGVGVLSEDETEAISGTGLELPATAGDAVVPVVLAIAATLLVVGVSRVAAVSSTGESQHHQPQTV
jgi:putative membrane protein